MVFMMTGYEIFSLIVSSLAILVAVVSLVRTRKIAAQQIELEKITAELSKKQLDILTSEELARSKAYIDVELEDFGNTHKFIVTNKGGAEATNVNFSIPGDGSPLVANEYTKKIPIKSLKPEKSVTLIAAISMGSPHEFNVFVSWNNPDGSQQNEKYLVSL